MKKNNNIKVEDDILIQYRIPQKSVNILTCFGTQYDFIANTVKKPLVPLEYRFPSGASSFYEEF